MTLIGVITLEVCPVSRSVPPERIMHQLSQQISRGASRSRAGEGLPKDSRGAGHAPTDSRWRTLSHIQQARRDLGISDREIAVLRGLLSLLPAQDWGGQMIVFASNRVLSQRCDSVDERTLRRRIVRLEAAGLVIRRQSSNGKRYRVKDQSGLPALTFGIDLTPLAELARHFEALADAAQKSEARVRLLKTLIRVRLEDLAETDDCPVVQRETARLSLRRKLVAEELEAILKALPLPPKAEGEDKLVSEVMSASDSQNVRHIQKSDKEDKDSDPHIKSTKKMLKSPPTTNGDLYTDLSVRDCLDAASEAAEFAITPITTWPELMKFTEGLAPAIGIDPLALSAARKNLGDLGSALAVLGLTQAIGRIRKPAAYLSQLAKRSAVDGIDCVRMFRSLTGTGTLRALH